MIGGRVPPHDEQFNNSAGLPKNYIYDAMSTVVTSKNLPLCHRIMFVTLESEMMKTCDQQNNSILEAKLIVQRSD